MAAKHLLGGFVLPAPLGPARPQRQACGAQSPRLRLFNTNGFDG
jgi:hypothetical protein